MYLKKLIILILQGADAEGVTNSKPETREVIGKFEIQPSDMVAEVFKDVKSKGIWYVKP